MEMVQLLKIFAILCTISCSMCNEVKKYSFLMPSVRPSEPELYLCRPIKVDPSKSYYIVGFQPNATMGTIHHMLLYGCTTPGSNDTVWNCGEMASSNFVRTYSPCGQGLHVIYAWARDAPALTLPPDVGFQVGVGTGIKYLVLQVHYASIEKFKDGSTDSSGISLYYTETPKSKLAGVILLGTSGYIPPNSITKMEAVCEVAEKKTIYPFAYRTHTHSLGKVVSGYRIRADENGIDQWTLLGKRDPLTPQMFYPVFNTDPIIYGDKLAARCTMESHRSTLTHIGATNKDEMCNFYLMYYVDHDTPLDMKYCFTQGPPFFSWKNSDQLNHIPDVDASSL